MELYSVFNLKQKVHNIPIYLKKGLQDELSYIISDKVKINKILSNLLENALKYTHEGFVELGYYIKNENLVLYIMDTGIGISQEYRHKIFERFSQEEKEISKKQGGLGLGLSISKENAQLLGGDITLESEKGKGATFFVTIPFKPVNKELKTNDVAEKKTKTDIRILLVEDEEINYLYIEEILNSIAIYNFILIHVKNGKEAVEMCRTKKNIDLILMDIKMPVMGGYKATKIIKSEFPQIPVIAQTAYSTETDRELALKSGCEDFISKPLAKDKLLELIYKYITV